jgi:rod shape-determining protein MreD
VSARAVNTARHLSPLAWLGAPVLLSVAATLVFATPIRVFSLPLPEPVFPLALAFAWAVIRPSVLPPFALLFLGLFLDACWDGPQGLWPLCLLAAYAAVLTARRLITGQDFLIMWAWYAAVVGAAFAVGFMLMTMDAGAAPNLLAVGWQFLATSALFPFAHWLIGRYEDADVRFR